MRFPLYPVTIGVAVCLPALAAVWLGLFSIARLELLADRSQALENVRLPRAELAVAVERRILLAAQGVRGYALSGDREALERAKADLAKAADALQDAKVAASRPGLADLAGEAEKIEYFLTAYKKAAEASVFANERVAADRVALAKAQETYAAAVDDYVAFRSAQWEKELAARYPAPEALRQHVKRLRTAQSAVWAGVDVRQAAETARADREPARLLEALPRYDEAQASLRDSSVGGEEEGKRLGPAFAALAECRRTAAALLQDWESLRETGRRILEAERGALAAAATLGGASLTDAAGQAGGLASSLRASRWWLGLAAGGILAGGIGFAVFVGCALGLPVRRCAAFAHDLSVGRLTGSLAVSGRGEIGELAESLKEMARRLGKRLAR